ncbi:MAG: HAD-IC family P-type ATPase [Alphaproteobacteria bacterium]
MAPSVVHDRVPGRVRFRDARLRQPVARPDAIVSGLLGVTGVRAARVNPTTGSILVHFAAPATVAALAAALDRLLSTDTPRPMAALRDRGKTGVPNDDPPWHALPVGRVLAALSTSSIHGLSDAEAALRLVRHGANELPRAEARSVASIFIEQMETLPVALLGTSALISLFTGGFADAAVILGVLALNGGIATVTESRAERTILGLSRVRLGTISAWRDGQLASLTGESLVPGDVIEVDPGVLVPADARLVECFELTVDESALTGESLPVHKRASERVAADAALGDRATMLYRGTIVTGGRGRAVVTATGLGTEIGRIHSLIGTVRPPRTPIERQLADVGHELIFINGGICALIFGLGLMRGHPVVAMLKSAISLAVAAVPEGLPAVATTTLALGIEDMRRRGVLVRRLDAVETLGAVQVVGLDKTGTLTANRMSVVALHLDGLLCNVTGGHLFADGAAVSDTAYDAARQLLGTTVLCSEVRMNGAGDALTLDGSPTETALVRAGQAFGIDVAASRRRYPLEASIPRGEGRKRMTTMHRSSAGTLLAVKGDPIEVLERCAYVLANGAIRPIDGSERDAIVAVNEGMASRALRVLGVARRADGGDLHDERGLTWLGLVGLADPIRPGAAQAVGMLHRAGVRTVMVTGDQSATAYAIARELDLGDGGEIRILEAGRLRDLTPDLLAALAPRAHVFARVSPANKLQIVQALQASGQIVAMTGDGVNDGPALRAAEIGVAMGGAGSEIAREVADIVLARDDLDGMIEAVRLGRATYANIRKVLRYLVSTNASETLVMLGAAIVGLAEPLTPMQLLWLNLVSDPLPALALGLEQPEPDVLEEKPHDPAAPILSRDDFFRLLREGGVIGAGALAAFLLAGRGPNAGTLAFHGLTLAQLLHALACRSESRGIFELRGRPANRKLIGALGLCLALQGTAQGLPPLRRLLNLGPLTPASVAGVVAAAFGPLIVNEAISALSRPRRGILVPGDEGGK